MNCNVLNYPTVLHCTTLYYAVLHLEEEDSCADSWGDNCPAGHEEVAGVIPHHVPDTFTEPPKHKKVFVRKVMLTDFTNLRYPFCVVFKVWYLMYKLYILRQIRRV